MAEIKTTVDFVFCPVSGNSTSVSDVVRGGLERQNLQTDFSASGVHHPAEIPADFGVQLQTERQTQSSASHLEGQEFHEPPAQHTPNGFEVEQLQEESAVDFFPRSTANGTAVMPDTKNDPKAGYDYIFQDTDLASEYNCGICLSVSRDPQQTKCCGATFCHYCITRALESSKNGCPICNKEDVELIPDKAQKQKINKLKVHCPIKGCAWVVDLADVEAHNKKPHPTSPPITSPQSTLQRKHQLDQQFESPQEDHYRLSPPPVVSNPQQSLPEVTPPPQNQEQQSPEKPVILAKQKPPIPTPRKLSSVSQANREYENILSNQASLQPITNEEESSMVHKGPLPISQVQPTGNDDSHTLPTSTERPKTPPEYINLDQSSSQLPLNSPSPPPDQSPLSMPFSPEQNETQEYVNLDQSSSQLPSSSPSPPPDELQYMYDGSQVPPLSPKQLKTPEIDNVNQTSTQLPVTPDQLERSSQTPPPSPKQHETEYVNVHQLSSQFFSNSENLPPDEPIPATSVLNEFDPLLLQPAGIPQSLTDTEEAPEYLNLTLPRPRVPRNISVKHSPQGLPPSPKRQKSSPEYANVLQPSSQLPSHSLSQNEVTNVAFSTSGALDNFGMVPFHVPQPPTVAADLPEYLNLTLARPRVSPSLQSPQIPLLPPDILLLLPLLDKPIPHHDQMEPFSDQLLPNQPLGFALSPSPPPDLPPPLLGVTAPTQPLPTPGIQQPLKPNEDEVVMYENTAVPQHPPSHQEKLVPEYVNTMPHQGASQSEYAQPKESEYVDMSHLQEGNASEHMDVTQLQYANQMTELCELQEHTDACQMQVENQREYVDVSQLQALEPAEVSQQANQSDQPQAVQPEYVDMSQLKGTSGILPPHLPTPPPDDVATALQSEAPDENYTTIPPRDTADHIYEPLPPHLSPSDIPQLQQSEESHEAQPDYVDMSQFNAASELPPHLPTPPPDDVATALQSEAPDENYTTIPPRDTADHIYEPLPPHLSPSPSSPPVEQEQIVNANLSPPAPHSPPQAPAELPPPLPPRVGSPTSEEPMQLDQEQPPQSPAQPEQELPPQLPSRTETPMSPAPDTAAPQPQQLDQELPPQLPARTETSVSPAPDTAVPQPQQLEPAQLPARTEAPISPAPDTAVPHPQQLELLAHTETSVSPAPDTAAPQLQQTQNRLQFDLTDQIEPELLQGNINDELQITELSPPHYDDLSQRPPQYQIATSQSPLVILNPSTAEAAGGYITPIQTENIEIEYEIGNNQHRNNSRRKTKIVL